MVKITEEDIRITASCLEWYVDYKAGSQVLFTFSGQHRTTDRDKPSIFQVYKAFESLPEKHPLKEKFDLEKVTTGYDLIVKEGQQNKCYRSLDWFSWMV